MKIPRIEVKLNKNYCLYDFLSRLSYYWPYKKEKKLYSKKLGKIKNNFFEFMEENKGKSHEFLIKNVSTFDNIYFRRLWKEFQSILEKQYVQVKKITEQEGKTYLKRILKITKTNGYPYKKIIVFLSFPKIDKIKPRKYKPTGSFKLYKDICIIYSGFSLKKKIQNANDLYVLWHEIIHSIAIRQKIWRDIEEGITELYEDIICKTPKKKIKSRLFETFKRYPKNLKEELIKTCLNWDWKRKNMFQLKFELANQYKKFKN